MANKIVLKTNTSIPIPPDMAASDPAFVRTLNDRLQRLSEAAASATSQTQSNRRVSTSTTTVTVDGTGPVQLVDITT